VWNIFEQTFRSVYFDEPSVVKTGGFPTFTGWDCLCKRAPLCPGDDPVCIDGISWGRQRELSYAVAGSAMAQLIEVHPASDGGKLNFTTVASMTVNLNPKLIHESTKAAYEQARSLPQYGCPAAAKAVTLAAGRVPLSSVIVDKFFSKMVPGVVGLTLFGISFTCLLVDTLSPAEIVDTLSPAEIAPLSVDPSDRCGDCLALPDHERAKDTPTALFCNRTCLDPEWYLSAPHFFEAMSADCTTVNSVPVREFWPLVQDNAAARERLRSNYEKCMGVIADPEHPLSKLFGLEMRPRIRPCITMAPRLDY
jgi:hypothetical protein